MTQKTYFLVAGAVRLQVGTTQPVYSPAQRAWETDVGRVSAWLETDYSVESEGEDEAPIPLPIAPPISPVQFKLLWTSTERVALRRFRASADPATADARDAMDDFFSILDDPRLMAVHMALPSTQAGVEFTLQVLQGLGVVQNVAARKAQILQGVFQ